MKNWFVRVELDVPATDEHAESLARHVGSTFVDRDRGRTEVSFYTSAASVLQAVNDGLERVNAAALRAGLDGTVIQVEVKTEADRVAELVSEGIPEVVGVAEIQKILQVNTRQHVGQLAVRDDFPRPVAELRAGRIWLRSDIDDFGKRWRRAPGKRGVS
jgi:hypothetical protein